jgi:hypothetical protein
MAKVNKPEKKVLHLGDFVDNPEDTIAKSNPKLIKVEPRLRTPKAKNIILTIALVFEWELTLDLNAGDMEDELRYCIPNCATNSAIIDLKEWLNIVKVAELLVSNWYKLKKIDIKQALS